MFVDRSSQTKLRLTFAGCGVGDTAIFEDKAKTGFTSTDFAFELVLGHVVQVAVCKKTYFRILVVTTPKC